MHGAGDATVGENVTRRGSTTGIRGGQVVGESDSKGEGPKDKGITPDDLAATFFTALGINPRKEYHTPSGRPVMITRYGTPIPQLIG